MQTKIVTIGDEILIGQITDTNSAWLGRRLNAAGIKVAEIISIQDNKEQIKKTLDKALNECEIVFVTGGLGPTKDDITKTCLAELFSCELVRDDKTYRFLETMLKERSIEFNELNRSQASVPSCCTVLPNSNGTAPGMWFERDGHVLVSMPGVPFEMKVLFEEEVLPRLKRYFSLKTIVHKTAITFGLPESILAETIASWENTLPRYIRLAYLPNPNGIRLRLSAYEMDGTVVAAEINRRFDELQTIIPNYFLGFDDATIESSLAGMLLRHKKTLSVAESCTGGSIAQRFTAMAGASDYFLGGVVSYSNEMKENILHVSHETLVKYGAVSEQVACQMAEGIRRITSSDYSIATTGIAGPTGGTDEKPVGTVWMAIATPEGTFAEKRIFGHLREQNIARATSFATNMLRMHILSSEKKK